MIELQNIHKHFGKVKALQGIKLRVDAGAIHGVIGENGAGKSTLMKILTGYIHRTSGSILFQGKEVQLRTPRDARFLGIGMLYQEPLDFIQLSVLDNFMAGAPRYERKSMEQALAELNSHFGFDLHPHCPLDRLTVGERQQLEILRLIHDGTKVLILDEPTTGISEKQQELLFNALTVLKEQGCAIILVSHKLAEVEQLCDRVSVLRQGKIVGEQEKPFDKEQLLTTMFDALPEHSTPPPLHEGETTILAFHNISSSDGRSGLDDISVSFTEGEIVGLAGLDGSGQNAFLKIAGNLLDPESGTLARFGDKSPKQRRQGARETIVFLPADRLAEGLIPGLSIQEHLLLANKTPLFIFPGTGRNRAKQAIETFNIQGQPQTAADDLSGGNQQRLLLSLMPPHARLILMENPTRGLDVQSGAWTWQHLIEQLPDNGALFFASPDLEEIMNHANRILVFFNGRIIMDKPTCDTTYHEISHAITGQAGDVS